MDAATFFSFAESLSEPVVVADSLTGEILWSSAAFKALGKVSGKKEMEDILRLMPLNLRLESLPPVTPGLVPSEKVMPVALPEWTGHIHVRAWTFREQKVFTAVFREEKIKVAERLGLALQRLSDADIINSGDFQAACRLIAETGAKTVYANWVGLWRADHENNRLVNEVVYNLESEVFTRIDPFPLEGCGRYTDLLRVSRTVVIHDTRTDTILPNLTANVNFARVRSFMDCPIRVGGRLEGVVSIEYGDVPHDWTEEERVFGASLADFAALALESRRAVKSEILAHNMLAKLPDTMYRRYNDYPLYTLDSISDHCFHLLGYSPGELTGSAKRRYFDLIHPDDLPEVKKAHEATFLTNQPLDVNYRLIHKNGEVRWVWDRGRVVEQRADRPELSLVEGFLTDYTERKIGRDEYVVRKIKREFLATISHEVYTPMNGILGLSRLLQETRLDPEQMKYATSIHSSAEALRHVITGILDYSKVETGQVGLVWEDFSLRDMLRDLQDMYQPEFVRKNLVFTTFVPADYPDVVNGDRGRVKQILMNLLSNAVKFTSQGWVVLRCAHELKQHEGRLRPLLTFQVADTGVGMKPQHVRMIGQPFTQADSSSSRRFGGAGLGLSICHRLCQMMDGGMECDSVPGQGSIFKVRVLLEAPKFTGDAEASVIAAAAAVPAVAEADVVSHAKKPAYAAVEADAGYILLVEDSPVNQMVATGVLKKMGHKVDVAENGFKAIEALKANNYDLVLMDCHMPEMDGFKATALLRDPRTGTRNPKVPVIAVTASVLEGSYDKCLEAGMDDYLAKPFKPNQLHEIISRWRRPEEGASVSSTAEEPRPEPKKPEVQA